MSIKAIEAALAGNRMIFLATQKALEVENPAPEDIHAVGTVGIIMRMLKLPDERIKILVQGLAKAKIPEYIQTDPYYSVRIDKLIEAKPAGAPSRRKPSCGPSRNRSRSIVSLGKVLIPDVMVVIENLEDPGRLADMVVSNLGLKVESRRPSWKSSIRFNASARSARSSRKEIEVLSMQQKIQAQAKGEMDKTQREYFLREQLKAIQKELGELDERAEEVAEFRKRIKDAKMPDKVLKETEKQLKRLEKMHPDTAESATVRTYLEWMVELPWSKKIEGQPRPEGRRQGPERGPLRPGKGQGAHPRVSRRPQAEREDEGPDPLLRRPAGRRKNIAGQIHRPRIGPRVRPHQFGRRAGRSRNPRPPPDLCRRAAGADHPRHEASRHQQSGLHARRSRQGRHGFSWRSFGRLAGGAGSGTEQRIHRPLSRACRSI